ncbi:pre-mRNA-splicing factor ATP-dependent RNA helicase DHX15/PRP43 [Angomonas deanei]|nr:pre-mRNA-splicing factor ATP-dependent RNA helicase DHX15/PRP43 [Angomonas deanei]|eukprot:EPY24577.1 pre-mRNA-splicing factor ATP-dependent RNA helicase DHX15/PRP43 [Angomonas deanei]
MDVDLGEQAGYNVRFQSKQSPATRVLFLTDGMLVREFAFDRDLSKYSCVIVDEVHERSVDTDVVLGLLKQLLERRPTFRLVVMSATLDIGKLQQFFPSAPLLQISGRRFKVEVLYMPTPVPSSVEAAVACVTQIHQKQPAGDVLCFLTGEFEIETAVKNTKAQLADALLEDGEENSTNENAATVEGKPQQVVVLPLYANLPLIDQEKIFKTYPPHVRKIVFSTNLAETSVTIDGVVYVVDSGYHKHSLFSAEGRVDYLLPAVISKASAEQRKGRAGRTREGKCYRLYTKEEFKEFPEQTHPEILRCNIVNVLLMLLTVGVTNPCHFPFIDFPSDESLEEAFYDLVQFGAVDGNLELTDLGRQLSQLPLDVSLAKMILKASKNNCAGDAIVLAAMLEAGNIFLRPSAQRGGGGGASRHEQFVSVEGDHFALIKAFHAYQENRQNGTQYCWENYLRHQSLVQASQIYYQLLNHMGRLNLPNTATYRPDTGTMDTTAIKKSLIEGFFMQVAFYSVERGCYITVRDGKPIKPHHHSIIHKLHPPPPWVLYDRLQMQGEGGVFFRVGCTVRVEWLLEASEYFRNPVEITDGEIALTLRKANVKL